MSFRKNIDSFLRQFEREFTTHNLIEVSRAAILHNLALFADSSQQQVIPVLKGNAYGHGIREVATALKRAAVPYIAVDGYYEALRIREVSNQPVLIMGAILPENFKRMRYDNFTFVVQNEATIVALGNTGKHIKVHIECNTGMNRYGIKPDKLASLTQAILRYKNLELEGVMSHLADSDGTDPATVDTAVGQFDTCVELVRAAGANPTILHVAQSAGSVRAASEYANCIRVGIGLYGLNPFPQGHTEYSKLQALQPALRLTSAITNIIDLEKGDKVSYNYTFTAPMRMRIGVLPLGYYEGAWTLARGAAKATGEVQVGDTFTPIVGKVCMNHTMISLDGISVKVGDRVVVYSNNPADKNAVDTIAREYGLFNYAMLTSLNCDVRRVLVA